MRSLILAVLTIAGISSTAFAATTGLDGLNRFDCTLESRDSEIEKFHPIAKTILAESEQQAVALYLVDLRSDTSTKTVLVSYGVESKDGQTQTKWALIKSVTCTRL